MNNAVAYRLSWQDWTAWVEYGGSMPDRKHPESHHETFPSHEAAEAHRAELRQRGRPGLIVSIKPLYAISAPVVRREKPRHGKRRNIVSAKRGWVWHAEHQQAEMFGGVR